MRGLAAFLVGMVPLVAAMAILDSAYSYLRYDAPFRQQWSVDFFSDMLGMLLIGAADPRLEPQGLPRGARGGARALAGAAGALRLPHRSPTHYVFSTRPEGAGFIPPLAYLCAPFLIWAALRFGLRAATLGLAIFGLISYWHTGHGFGPFAIDGLGGPALAAAPAGLPRHDHHHDALRGGAAGRAPGGDRARSTTGATGTSASSARAAACSTTSTRSRATSSGTATRQAVLGTDAATDRHHPPVDGARAPRRPRAAEGAARAAAGGPALARRGRVPPAPRRRRVHHARRERLPASPIPRPSAAPGRSASSAS